MKWVTFAALLLMLLAAVSGWAETTAVDKIKPGERLTVKCMEEPALDKTYEVTADGLIVLPFVGAVEVAGKTEIEAAAEISGVLIDQRILRRATISVVREKPAPPKDSPVRISGAVSKVVELPFADGLRLSDLVRLAQPTMMADLSKIEVTSSGGQVSRVAFEDSAVASLETNPYLKPGDQVYVPIIVRAMEYYVLGGVKRPGVFKLGEPITLAEAVQLAGGIDDLGDSARVRLERTRQSAVVYDLSAVTRPVVIEPGDRIIVELSASKRYLLVVGNVTRPGQVEFREGMTLTQAIADAGGLNERKPTERVAVYSRDEVPAAKPVIYDIQKIMQGFVGDIALKPGDRIEAMAPGQRNPKGLAVFTAAALIMILAGR